MTGRVARLRRSASLPRRAAQRGIVMWVALVMLIVMSLAGLAMLRQMGGGVSIAGNIAFKESATASADAGAEAARRWLVGPPTQTTAVLEADQTASGYYATWHPDTTVDPRQLPWNTGVAVTLDANIGNTARYIIQRLCDQPGSVLAVTQNCSDMESTWGQSKESLSYGPAGLPSPTYQPYFRITTEVRGPRNTVSYTQVIVN